MRVILLCACATLLLAALPSPGEREHESPPRYTPPRVVEATNALYPINSVASGTVIVEVTINEEGRIAGVKVVRGIASLTEAAEQAILQWKFEPAQFEGRPVSSRIPVAFSFVPPGFGPRVSLPAEPESAVGVRHGGSS